MARAALTTRANQVLANGNPMGGWHSTAGTTIYPGAAVDQTSATEVTLSTTGSVINTGIASEVGRLAIDSAFAAAEQCYVYYWGSSAQVYGYFVTGSGDASVGKMLIIDGTTAGMLDIAGDLSAVDIRTVCGRAAEWLAQDGTDDIPMKVSLSI